MRRRVTSGSKLFAYGTLVVSSGLRVNIFVYFNYSTGTNRVTIRESTVCDHVCISHTRLAFQIHSLISCIPIFLRSFFIKFDVILLIKFDTYPPMVVKCSLHFLSFSISQTAFEWNSTGVLYQMWLPYSAFYQFHAKMAS